MLYHIFLIV